ncbi:MAG TPA: NAD-dependent epimerase/dehydratase family protein [Candidatus Binatia bacterium]|jgi:nucleoside-diphosphate-sugar epimerase
MARALVTGGSGYFGTLLRDRLCQQGYDVRIFDLLDADDRPSSVEYLQGDIRDLAAVKNACEGIDVVYHNVAQVPLAKDRHLFDSVNLGGTQNLVDAAAHTGVRRVVHTSSSAVFGRPERNPVDEDTEPRPLEAYGRAKLDAERVVTDAARSGKVDAAIVRPRTILGHGRLGIFQILFDWVEEGRKVPVLGRGDNVYQFVHADDLADACILVGARSGFGIYHCGAARFGTMRETLETLCRHANTGSRVISLPMGLAKLAMKITGTLGLSPLGPYHWLMYGESLYFDIRRARSELGWEPRWSNSEMIIESYEWYRAHKRQVLAATGRSAHRSALRQGVLGVIKRGL